MQKVKSKMPKASGKRDDDDEFKIVGGSDVTNHTWPFLVNIGNVCGGSIIGKSFNTYLDYSSSTFCIIKVQ